MRFNRHKLRWLRTGYLFPHQTAVFAHKPEMIYQKNRQTEGQNADVHAVEDGKCWLAHFRAAAQQGDPLFSHHRDIT